jgi:hypothetical protein
MKQVMGIEKKQDCINHSIAAIDDADYNWDSFEIMAVAYTEKIQQHEQTLNTLTIMDDAQVIIRICNEIKFMKTRLRRGW